MDEIGKGGLWLNMQKQFCFAGSFFKTFGLLLCHRYDLCYCAITCHGSGFLKTLDKQHKVIFTGPLSGDALYAWYNIADIFVLPSTKEPFGAVTNEALMAGCKCLISERAGSSCLIKKDYNGDCFNPLDEEELYNKLKKMLEGCISHDKSEIIKPSLMPITFNQEISKVINAIDSF